MWTLLGSNATARIFSPSSLTSSLMHHHVTNTTVGRSTGQSRCVYRPKYDVDVCHAQHSLHETPQSGNRVSTSLGNSGLCWTVFARNRDTAVPAEGNGDLQTLICVLVARPRRCLTLSNPVPWQNWMAVYLGYTLRMKMLFRGWPVMVHDTHTRRRRRLHEKRNKFTYLII